MGNRETEARDAPQNRPQSKIPTIPKSPQHAHTHIHIIPNSTSTPTSENIILHDKNKNINFSYTGNVYDVLMF